MAFTHNSGHTPLKRKVQMLAQVAAETFDRSEYFIPRKTLTYSFESFLSRTPNTLEHIDGNVILSTIIAQHGLFQEPAREVFSFAHLTFHEYFAARYVTEYEAQGTVPQLMKHYADQRFREVFLLTAYQLHDTRGFFESFLTHLTEDAQRRKKLADLLRQATHKAFTASGKYCAQAVGRSIYIYLALNLAVAEDHALNLARDLEVERNRALDRARELNLFLDKALDEVRQIALDLHLISHHDLGRASEHFHSLWNSFGQAQQLAYHRDEVLYRVDGITQELAHIRAREQARDISLDLIRHLDTDLALGRALDCTLDRAFDCNLDLARSPHAQLARDISLVNARILINDALAQPNKDLRKAELITLEAFLETAKAQAGALDDPRMQENLSHLVGGIQRLASRWERLMVKDLRSELDTILKAAELVFPSLDDEDWSIVARYLDGNRLLLACLDQAAVPDREAIKDRLLLLPDA